MTTASPIVLLAHGGATPDPAAAWTACDLARRLGARLHVVHVAPPSARTTIPAYTVLATLVAQCASAGGIVTRANLRLGVADEEILAEAKEIGAGLVVMSGRQRAAGEPGERLADRAPCPVLIVREQESDQARVRLTIAGTGIVRPRRPGFQRAVAG